MNGQPGPSSWTVPRTVDGTGRSISRGFRSSRISFRQMNWATSGVPIRAPFPHELLLAPPGACIATTLRDCRSLKAYPWWRTSGTVLLEGLRATNQALLPNAAECYTVKKAFSTASMAREVFQTDFLKLEVIGDDQTLQPDRFGL